MLHQEVKMKPVEIELYKIELKYSHLRTNAAKPKAGMVASFSLIGQQNPVLVILTSDKKYILIDGYKRVYAARKLAIDLVFAIVLNLDEASALLLWHSQEQSSTRSAIEDGWFLQELIDQHNLSREKLANKLQRSESWISRRLALVTDLPEEVQSVIRSGQICPYAVSKFLIPLARTNKTDCLTLVKNLGKKHISSRELECIYKAWIQGTKHHKENIVNDPKLFLQIEKKIQKKPDEQRKGSLLQNIEIVYHLCCRSQTRFWKDVKESTEFNKMLFKKWDKATAAFLALKKLIDERKTNVE